jgi:hypothetical protein
VVRNCAVHAEGLTISFGAGISGNGTDIVIYRNHIHDLWRGADLDCHGIVPGAGSLRYWILENHIHGNSGDGVQACHGCSPAPRWVYIGGNTIHDDRENAVDLKYVDDVVISRNVCYGYENASTSDGVAMVVGSDGAPNRPWIIGNTIHSSARGIRIEEVDSAWIVGNQIFGIDDGAIMLEKQGASLHIVNNTVHDADVFIDQFWQETFGLHVRNNIVSQMRGEAYGCHMNIESNVVAGASTFENNLFFQSEGPVVLNLGAGGNQANFERFSTTPDFDALPFGTGNRIGDPLFADTSGADFSIEEGSAAVNTGSVVDVYETFEAMHGLNIRYDLDGTPRPQGSAWDIGAYEYSTSNQTARRERPGAASEIRVWPNPSAGRISIRTDAGVRDRIEVTVYDANGRLVWRSTRSLQGAVVTWDGADLRGDYVLDGAYMLRVALGDGTFHTKVVLTR